MSAKHNKSLTWIQKQIFNYEPIEKIHNPREVILVCDATFYGKRGLYRAFQRNFLAKDKTTFASFEDYPVQMCHFHQKIIIQRYITKHPKLEISQELKKIVSSLTKTTDLTFTIKLDKWYDKYKDF